jgi:hypothetical protein
VAEVDFLVKLRDAAAMILDAATERLEKIGSPGANKTQGAAINLAFDPSKLTWQTKTGPKGEYEICTQTNHDEFKKAMGLLESGGDQITHLGCFYWIMTNRTAIARKMRAKK